MAWQKPFKPLYAAKLTQKDLTQNEQRNQCNSECTKRIWQHISHVVAFIQQREWNKDETLVRYWRVGGVQTNNTVQLSCAIAESIQVQI
jgi:hypothetical protein